MSGTALLAVLLAGAPPGPVTAGLYFEQTTRLIRPDGVETPGVSSRVWCAGPRMRLEAGDAPGGPALVLRLDQNRVLRLDPEARVATELDATRLRARSHTEAAVAAGLMSRPDEERLRRTPLAGHRKIAGHRCRGFRLSGATVTLEAWVAEDLPLPARQFADFIEWSGAAQALPALVEAIRALPGFPLETRVKVNVLGEPQETLSTVTAIRELRIDLDRFEVPRGYRVVKEPAPEEEPR